MGPVSARGADAKAARAEDEPTATGNEGGAGESEGPEKPIEPPERERGDPGKEPSE